MRLTLRSLLAYLDDVLEPATLKEIGSRVSESPSASATVARIKEVIRRRRISAPELSGPGSAPDPNLVAEYLDNTIAPDAIPALEKLCLDSDMHLAEVASSHQILTAVLGEPVEVPLSTRERMYALVSPSPLVAEPVTPKSGTHKILRDSGIIDTVAPATQMPIESRPQMPDYLRPAGGRRLALVSVGVCLALGWMFWIIRDQGLLPGMKSRESAADSQVAKVDEAPHDHDNDHERIGKDHSAEKHPSAENAASSNSVASKDTAESPDPVVPPQDNSLVLKGGATPAADADEPAAESEPSKPKTPSPETVSLTPASEPVTEPPATPVPAAVPEPSPAIAPAKAFPNMIYSNAEGVLIVKNHENEEWTVLPRRALVRDGDEIASPAPFQAEFLVDGSVLGITLQRGSRIRLEPGLGPDLLTIRINRGRVTIRRPQEGNHPEPLSIGIGVYGQLAQLTLNEPGTVCGIEVEQRAPYGRKPDPLLLVPEGGVYVVSGSASLAWNGGAAVVVGADLGWAGWPVPPNPLSSGPQRPVPNWLTPEGIPQTNADRKWGQMFEKEFNVDQTVSMSIPSLVADRREMVSAYATSTLGLVDDIPMLVKGLQSEHEKTRQAAIWSLRNWLPTAPDNTARLEQEVARIFPEDVVTDVVELLWGYSKEDGKDPIISQKLVSFMDHKQIAVRELAFYYVSQITPRTNAHGYRPSLAESPRNAALTAWRNLLEKNGGQLVK